MHIKQIHATHTLTRALQTQTLDTASESALSHAVYPPQRSLHVHGEIYHTNKIVFSVPNTVQVDLKGALESRQEIQTVANKY